LNGGGGDEGRRARAAATETPVEAAEAPLWRRDLGVELVGFHRRRPEVAVVLGEGGVRVR
jgi:hypothetical protein